MVWKEFCRRLVDAYMYALKKTGWYNSYVNVPMPIPIVYDAYVELYGEDIGLEEFFNKVREAGKECSGIRVGYHPAFYSDINYWHITVDRAVMWWR